MDCIICQYPKANHHRLIAHVWDFDATGFRSNPAAIILPICNECAGIYRHIPTNEITTHLRAAITAVINANRQPSPQPHGDPVP